MMHAFVITLVVIAIIAIAINIAAESKRKKPAPNHQTQAGAAQQTATTQQPTTTSTKRWIITNWKKTASAVLGVCLVLLAVWGLWSVWSWIKTPSKSSVVSSTGVENKSHSAPMEIALAVIADCESGDGTPGSGKQFYPDGRLVWNLEGSTAVGKYQILASMHEERAKKMGFDIRTEEGNEGYARVLYSESKTKHWEADPRSAKCWEPRLRAYTWGGGEAVSIVVVAPTNKWSDLYPSRQKPDGGKLDLAGGGKKYWVRWNEGMSSQSEEILPRGENPSKQPDPVYNFRLKSNEGGAIPIIAKFY